MDYDIVASIVAGLVATGVMTAMMYVGRAMMPEQMPLNIPYMVGSMMDPVFAPAYMTGFVMHLVLGVVFAIVHTALYQAFGLESQLLLWGLLFGAVHWVAAGMGMGMVGTVHPLIRSGEIAAPGPFLRDYPMVSVVGFLMLHLIFGLTVGGVYEALR